MDNIEKINQKIIKNEKTGCWEWLGNIDQYGKRRININGKHIAVVRELYEYQYSTKLTSSDLILQKESCINVKCVNPIHFEKKTKSEYGNGKQLPISQRLIDNIIIQDNGCWEWQLSLNKHGYGLIGYKGKDCRVHRLSFEVFKHPITKPVILHSCDNRRCINPEHLSEGTQLENVQDCINKGRRGSK